MAASAKILFQSTAPENVSAPKIVSPAEVAFARLKAVGKLSNWFHGRHGLDGDGWTCMVSGIQATLAPAVGGAAVQVNPTINATGGPNNVPYALGKATDPAGVMLTPAGVDVISWAAPFTICAVAKAGSGSSSTLCGLIGNNIAALAISLRSSFLLSARSFLTAGSITGTHRWPTVPGTGYTIDTVLRWHNIEIVWTGNASAGILSLYVDGIYVGESASFTPPTQQTTRLSIMGAFDLTLDLDAEGRGVSIAHLAVCPVSFIADTVARDAWRAMVLEQCGVLPAV